jgi:2-desacetyl-2-hydroxyethyl bacteriochlorophyllide A dehydrogenase
MWRTGIMKTIVLEQPGHLLLTETTLLEELAPDEALVRVHRVGICGTDLHAYRGRQPFFSYPRILGHELGVEIMQLGAADTTLHVGEYCAVEPYLDCGHCIACRRGKPNCCVHLKVLGVHVDGGMREYFKVPLRKLHRSESLSLDQLALVETLGIGAHAVARAQLEKDEFVLVIGAGPIGLSVLQFAQLAGAQIIVLDMNEQRLNFCRHQFGVEFTVQAGADALERLQEVTGGDLPTMVFDATGNLESMQQAFRYVAAGGRLILVGLAQGEVTFYDPDFHRRELTILSSRNSTAQDFVRIIRLMEEHQIDTTPWITHRAASGDMVEQFPQWLEPAAGVIKAMVEF